MTFEEISSSVRHWLSGWITCCYFGDNFSSFFPHFDAKKRKLKNKVKKRKNLKKMRFCLDPMAGQQMNAILDS